MAERSGGTAALLPDGPWQTEVAPEPRPAEAQAAEIGSVVVGMGSLFLFGLGLGADGDLRLLPLGIGLAASAAAFLLPDALQRRMGRAQALAHVQRRQMPYSEDQLLAQWPARRIQEADDRLELSA